ncbi:hypothetical protein AM501_15400 [Aneurinibacillus migulanus]|uniref:HAD family hydrolase n=1 Tax=Aneurinibacillus migulanus TaxID=47500 RepID=UPI0005BDAA5A|nr:HAD family hydrolase [Aneurinibacillus migulanus]KIV53479.1 hypothetical protein TS64_18725 [Aneurinibacillus migulanus]KPD07428.1 hypothetical protein AM501_15400 [Aneurinibacillus migulanus]
MNRMLENIEADLWQKDVFLSGLADILPNIKVLSLDIFDTILFRLYHRPIDVFIEIGKRAIEKGMVREGITAVEFQKIRILAEKKARSLKKIRYGNDEVNLFHIYDAMPKNIGNIEKLRILEFEIEKHACYINPSIYSLISYCKSKGIQIALLSDMYLSSDQIKILLADNYFPIEWIDQLVVSNEIGIGKAGGKLFDKLLCNYPSIQKKEIIHIGDNKTADIDGARCAGIQSIYYGVIPQNLESVFEWEHIRHGVVFPQILSLRKLAYYMNAEYDKEDKFWFQVGASILGPFFVFFSEWVVHSCKKEKRSSVYPFMREGALLASLIREGIKNEQLNIEVKPLYVSRQATYFAGIESFDTEQLGNMFERNNFTVFDLIRMFKLEDTAECLKQYYHVMLTECKDIELTEGCSLRRYLIDFFSLPHVANKVNELIEKERSLLIKYIEQTCQSVDEFVTVDLGFKGTIQKSIEKALQLSGFDSKLTHLLAIGSEPTSKHLLEGMDIRGWIGNAGENQDFIRTLMRSPEIIEELIQAECGSTLGYQERNDSIVPILSNDMCSEQERRYKNICQQGILFFQKLWFHLKKNKKFLIEDMIFNKREWGALLHRLIDMPTRQEATLLGTLHHDDNFGSDHISTIIHDKDTRLLEKWGTEEFLERCSHGYHATNVYWPQGVVTVQQPSYFFRKYLQQNEEGHYLAAMNRMASTIKSEGLTEIIVYGAGDVGQCLIKVANLHKLQVRYIVDRKTSLWGEQIDSIEITSLDRMVNSNLHIYAVASLSFAKEIERDIQEAYKHSNVRPTIFTPI